MKNVDELARELAKLIVEAEELEERREVFDHEPWETIMNCVIFLPLWIAIGYGFITQVIM